MQNAPPPVRAARSLRNFNLERGGKVRRHVPPAWRETATEARTAAMTRPSGALRGEGVKRRPYRTPRCLSRQQRTKRWWDQDRSHLGAAPAMLRITPTSKQSWRDSSASHAQIRRRKHTCAPAPRTKQLSDRTSRCEGHRFEGAAAERSDVANCGSAAPTPCQTAFFYSAPASARVSNMCGRGFIRVAGRLRCCESDFYAL